MSLPEPSAPDEAAACTPSPLNREYLNPAAVLPFGCTPQGILAAMEEFTAFLGAVNRLQLSRDSQRLECLLGQATFSNVVHDYMVGRLPTHCPTVVTNTYHHGHPDLIPPGKYPLDAVQHGGTDGIEIKASRRCHGWQGHNEEDCWLLVFLYRSNKPSDHANGRAPRPFEFTEVVGAAIEKGDWKFQGRSETSRRTPTAGILAAGARKLRENWIYRVPAPPAAPRTGRRTRG